MGTKKVSNIPVVREDVQSLSRGLTIKENTVYITSRMVADKFGKAHRTVLQNIYSLRDTNDKEVREFNRSNYKLVTYRDDKQREYPEFLMTRDGFSLLAMGFTGTEVVKWKIKYIAAFNYMEETLRKVHTNTENPEWLEKRAESKIVRKDFTATIKKFIEYAKAQGSQNADRYYIHYTKMSYGILDMLAEETRMVFHNFRDNLEIQGLSSIVLAENAAVHWLEKGMAMGMEYHDIFYFVKEKVSETIGCISLPHATKTKTIDKLTEKIQKEAQTRTKRSKKLIDKML